MNESHVWLVGKYEFYVIDEFDDFFDGAVIRTNERFTEGEPRTMGLLSKADLKSFRQNLKTHTKSSLDKSATFECKYSKVDGGYWLERIDKLDVDKYLVTADCIEKSKVCWACAMPTALSS